MSRRYMTAAAVRDLAARLSARDFAVIQRLSELRFVRGDQLARLCFAASADPAVSVRAARRSLHHLVELSVLARLPRPIGGIRAGSAGFVYYLALGGQRLAELKGWQPERPRRRSIVPGTMFVNHALQVAELHTRLVEADRSGRIELLELVAEPSSWRAIDGLGNQRAKLKPDSYARFGIGAYEDSYFFEVDRGTEGSRAIERQLDLYVAYAASGQEQAAREVFPKVLWLTTTDERVEALRASIERTPRHARRLFAALHFEALPEIWTPTATRT
jgi:Replication-relaxation